MSKLDDPARLLDARSDTTAGVRAVLRSGQRGLPGPDQLARLSARLPLGPLPPPTGSVPVAPVILAPLVAPSVVPGVIIGALLGLLVVAGWAVRDAVSSRHDDSVAAVVVTKIDAPTAAPPVVEARPVDAPVARPDPARAPAIASSAPRGGVAPGATVEGSPADAPSPPIFAGDLETEVHLLERARGVLGADPGAALGLATEHARRFPGGALGQERELIAVTALVALGRRPEAQARAASLLERFPASPYRARLESLGFGR